MPRATARTVVPVDVQVSGDHTPDIADYAERRVRSVLRYAHQPVLHARVRLTRHHDPAVSRPVTAQSNLDVNGRLVRAQVVARTAQEAVDQLHDRLRQRLRHVQERVAGHWEARRGRMPTAEPHEWRHAAEPTHRPPYFPRPAGEREIVRHKSYTIDRCTVDEAAFDMAAMDYDFHLFTELGSGQDSVLYYDESGGYRLAQLTPQPDALAPHHIQLTVSDRQAPLLSTVEATERMNVWVRPFLFFLDADRGRGALLYHRYDGHYGLITPAD